MYLFRIIAVTMLLLAGVSMMNPPCAIAVPVRKPAWEAEPLPKARVDWNTTRLALEMDGKPWRAVLEWFADQTGMSYKTFSPPAGTFTFIGPKLRQYTLTEIYDIINERLQAQEKLTLLRGETTLTMVAADEELPGDLIPRVALSELKDRGRTEIVEVVVTLKGLDNMKDLGREVKRLLGIFGNVVPLGNNQFLLRADVATLRRILSPFHR